MVEAHELNSCSGRTDGLGLASESRRQGSRAWLLGKSTQMMRNSLPQATSITILGSALALVALLAGCPSGMGGDQNFSTGNQELRNGIGTVRAGIKQYQTGDTTGGLGAIHQGRDMMGQGVVMMGLGCCIFDGGVIVDDGGATAGCASMMGMGATPMMQGLANFDVAHRAMMANTDPGTVNQALVDMETGMQMMEQGAGQMMNGRGMGSMGMM
jgi:hypothetical protein